MKTNQDFALGFKMQYPSNMIIEKESEQGSSNVTLDTPVASTEKYLSVVVTVICASALVQGFGLNPFNLDASAYPIFQ